MMPNEAAQISRSEHKEKDKRKPCPRCGLLALLYEVRHERMCESCGQLEITHWNKLVRV